MPGITAETLCEYLNRDLPGAVAPARTPPPKDEGSEEKPAKGKRTKPDFLSTSDTVVFAERVADVARYIRDVLHYTYLSDIAVVDYLDDGLFELVYRFYHLEGGDSLVVKTRVPRDQTQVPSLTSFWPAANFHEREGFDLFGIQFVGHPDLKRIYMWEEFEGHPMRKDFPRQGDKYLGE